MLTTSLLSDLEDAWARHRAPIVDHLRPGLSEGAIARLTQPLGLRLPVEARTWWAWHDGVSAQVPIKAARELGPDLAFLPLEEAVGLYGHARQQAIDVGGEQADYWWRPSWFPVTECRGEIRCDCSVAGDASTPIYWAYSHDHDAEGLTVPRVDSFGTMVSWWIEALDTGAWRYDADASRWERDPELLPPEREHSGLV